MVAQRTLKYVPGDGASRDVEIRIIGPFSDALDSWCFRVVVTGLEQSIDQNVYGADSLQALLQALEFVRISLQPYIEALDWGGIARAGITYRVLPDLDEGAADLLSRIDRLIAEDFSERSTRATAVLEARRPDLLPKRSRDPEVG